MSLKIDEEVKAVSLVESFSKFGCPGTLVSDTEAQFRADDFKFFCMYNNNVNLPSPPYHPQSNGQAAYFVETFKRTMKRLKRKGQLREFWKGFC